MTVFIDTAKGSTAITGCCVIRKNFPPIQIKAMEMEVIPPGTNINCYKAYDIMLEVKQKADFIIPLHEPEFANGLAISQTTNKKNITLKLL